ncbi:sporulation protein Cse60 [Paenibacillus sp. sptzw28]|uniref:sporulation protein Cse60 n=1 Tax=Paenibacillus sp. sptzw28 TaxID=715179 RepID=UPI001C6E6054|nr:sporulation protein Cse60 [Paenibacillus sp. sptzw28]QYR22221.1 sporulation protein Cse60 [Paenibacillus sp. sptzw28]
MGSIPITRSNNDINREAFLLGFFLHLTHRQDKASDLPNLFSKEEVTRLPKQVKIFTSSIPDELENQVNEFLGTLDSSDVIDVEYRTMSAISTEDDGVTEPSGLFSVLVFYKE